MPKHIRRIRIEGNVAYVPLTRNHEAVIDAVDVNLVSGCNWTAYVTRNNVYGFRQPTINGKKTYLAIHHAIMGKHDGFEIDHIDGNGLNNKRENLRVATRSQNEVNKSKSKRNTSGHKGVCWDASRKKWSAEVRFNGVRKRLGRFLSFDEACEAYRKEANKMHGDFVRLT